MRNFKYFKSLLPVNISFVGAGKTVYLEVDESGIPLLSEARKRILDGGLVEVKDDPKKELPGGVSIEPLDIDSNAKKGVK